jgi:hypothetical protein
MATNKKNKKRKKKSVASVSMFAPLTKPRLSPYDENGISLLLQTIEAKIRMPSQLCNYFERELEQSASLYLRIALAFHNFRFLNMPWILGAKELNTAMQVIRNKIGDDFLEVLKDLALLADQPALGENEREKPAIDNNHHALYQTTLLYAVYQLHGVTYRAESGAERENLFRDGVQRLIDANLFHKKSVQPLLAKIVTILKARSAHTQAVQKAFVGLDAALGKMSVSVISKLSPVLNAFQFYITYTMPEVVGELALLNNLNRHVFEPEGRIVGREISFGSADDLLLLDRFLVRFPFLVCKEKICTDSLLKIELLRFHYNMRISDYSAIEDFSEKIIPLISESDLTQKDQEKIKSEIINVLVTQIMGDCKEEEEEEQPDINITPILKHYPTDYRLCCLEYLLSERMPYVSEFTNFHKDVFIWAVSQVKFGQRKKFIQVFHTPLSSIRKQDILNSAINYSIYHSKHGEALWRVFTGPAIRGEYSQLPVNVSDITEHFSITLKLAVLWAEYERNKFETKKSVLIPYKILVSIVSGIPDLLTAMGSFYTNLTGNVILRRWKEFLPVIYEKNLLAEIGPVVFSVSENSIDDVVTFLNEKLQVDGPNPQLAQTSHRLSILPVLSNQHRKELKNLHKKTENTVKLKFGNTA